MQGLQAQVQEHNTALLSRFDTEKTYAHDTATYMFLLLGIPPKLVNPIFWMNKA